ncbi:hypothetical protein JTE90_005666 [Oedothorax gibbosus]|uniref:Uncharacterized protein n=1 Tax=Oedothorax gibbosus TaxID=931172 RepID=A0AAV6UFM1_9ARAC|nr:hypothetical protein JTE90_005666 [Oedothorax gibbosus]
MSRGQRCTSPIDTPSFVAKNSFVMPFIGCLEKDKARDSKNSSNEAMMALSDFCLITYYVNNNSPDSVEATLKINSTMLFAVVVACLVCCSFVGAQEECKDQMKIMKEAFGKNIKDWPCFEKFNLKEFMCSEDGSDETEKMEEFKTWKSKQSEADQAEIETCVGELIAKTMADCGDQLTEDCKKIILGKLGGAAR